MTVFLSLFCLYLNPVFSLGVESQLNSDIFFKENLD